jgi:hypothetical protein
VSGFTSGEDEPAPGREVSVSIVRAGVLVIIVVIALIATAFAVHAGRATDEAGAGAAGAQASQEEGRWAANGLRW